MGIDRPGGTDTRTENVENPPLEERPPAPPPDRPGSPGQPSRLESRRAAREAQEARRAETGTQQAAPQETGTEQREERQKDQGESSSAEPADKDQDAQADPKTPERAPGSETESDTETGSGERGRETDRPESETGLARPDGRGEQLSTVETGEPAPEQGTEPRGEVQDDKAEPSSDGPADKKPDAPADPQTAEERPMTGESDPGTGQTGQPDGSSDEPPRQDTGDVGPGSPGDRARPDDSEAQTKAPQDQDHQPLPQQDGRAPGDDAQGEADNEQTPQVDNEPAGHDHTPQDEPAPADQEDSGSETPQPAEDPVRASDNPEPGDSPQVRVAWPPAAEEGVTRWVSPAVQFNEQMPGNQLERRDRNAEDRPGTPATTEDEPNKYRNLPELTRDGTPGRGELRRPEDDPVDRDPAPEEGRRKRWEPFERAKTGVEGVKKVTEGAKGYVEKPPPTGQAEVKTDAGPSAPKVNQANPTDTITGGIMLAALTIGAIFKAKDKIKDIRRN